MKTTLLLLALTLAVSSFKIPKLTRTHQHDEAPPAISYPVRAVYIDRSQYWYGDKIAIALAVPGYAQPHDYNHVLLAFWMCGNGVADMALVWSDAYKFFGAENTFGKSTDQIQKALKKIYNNNGIRIMVSAFGATEFPTTNGLDPTMCAQKLGDFVLQNNLDGVDIDWEDNQAMNQGKGQDWLITFTTKLRSLLPKHIITHAPQAPYFKNEHYSNGAYKTVHQKVGHMIDFYMVQFYNQGDSRYDTFEQLFVHATGSDFSGTAVKEIADRGIPLKKIIIGKPILQSDASNTGWISPQNFGKYVSDGFTKYGWYGGVMYWQYPSDYSGASIKKAAGDLIEKCKQSGTCI